MSSRARRHRHRHASRGFTLVEIMIVVAILGILAAAVTGRYLDSIDMATASVAQSFEQELAKAAQMYSAEYGNIPHSFWQFVGVSQWASETNHIYVPAALRRRLADPEAEVMLDSDRRILFQFGNGLVAQYYISTSGQVTADYAGPMAPASSAP